MMKIKIIIQPKTLNSFPR